MIYITDTVEKYVRSNHERKILYTPISIISSSFLSQKQIDGLNLKCLGLEYLAAEQMLSEINSRVEKYPIFTSSYLNDKEDSYSILYPIYWKIIRPYKEFQLFIQLLIVEFNLSKNDLQFGVHPKLILNSNSENLKLKNENTSVKNSPLKQLAKKVYRVFNPKLKSNSKKNCVLFLYDVQSVQSVVEQLVIQINQQDQIHLHVILINMLDRGKAVDKPFNTKSISYYKADEFRLPIGSKRNQIYSEIAENLPELIVALNSDPLAEIEYNHQLAHHILTKNKVDAVIYLGVLEIGRAISAVAKKIEIPSFNIDYGLFSDDPLFMENKISFDYKCCISPLSSDIWKKRNDSSIHHIITGFLKLDSPYLENQEFIPKKKHNFSILFLSSWSGTSSANDQEKTQIITNLISICSNNEWNLIIKLHPSEDEKTVQKLLSKYNSDQFSFQKKGLIECFKNTDFVISQSSSALSEALYYDKPIAYYLLNKDSKLIDYLPIKSTAFQLVFHEIEELEVQIQEIKNEKHDLMNKYSDLKNYVWKYTDQKSTNRFLELLEKSIRI